MSWGWLIFIYILIGIGVCAFMEGVNQAIEEKRVKDYFKKILFLGISFGILVFVIEKEKVGMKERIIMDIGITGLWMLILSGYVLVIGPRIFLKRKNSFTPTKKRNRREENERICEDIETSKKGKSMNL
jgi:vacuolar-type H+-ATPase subunit I/STV1